MLQRCYRNVKYPLIILLVPFVIFCFIQTYTDVVNIGIIPSLVPFIPFLKNVYQVAYVEVIAFAERSSNAVLCRLCRLN